MTVQAPSARPRMPWIAIAPWGAIAGLSCLVILTWQGMGLLSLLLGALRGAAGVGVVGLGARLALWGNGPVFGSALPALALSRPRAALAHRHTIALSQSRMLFDRAYATDLGWGTANAIATILLVLSPVL